MSRAEVLYHAANHAQSRRENISMAAGEIRCIEANLRGAGALSAETGRVFQLAHEEMDRAVDEAQAEYDRIAVRCGRAQALEVPWSPGWRRALRRAS